MKIKLTDIDAQLRETPSLTGNENKVLTVSSDGATIEWRTPEGGSASYPSFTGNQGRVLKVNATEDGVVWAIDEVGDATLPSFSGQAGKVLKVNAQSNGVEWSDDLAEINPFIDAPNNGFKYARQNGSWVLFAEGVNGTNGADGAKGDKGDKGDTGAAGPGVPSGGFTGQFLYKINGEDFNTGWIDPPAGGGGGTPANPTINYSSWGKVVTTINQTFDNDVIPTNFIWKDAIPGTIVTQPDAGPSTTRALQFPLGGIEFNGDGWFEIRCVADAIHNEVRIRYLTQGEPGYDGLRLNLDGSQIFADLLNNEGYKEFSTALSPGPHILRFRYTSDGSVTGGFQNTRFSQIIYPDELSTIVYQHGDTVRHNGYVWLCLQAGTNQEPGAGDHWARIIQENPYRFGGFITSTPIADEVVMMHVAVDPFTLGSDLAGARVKVGTPPTAQVVFLVQNNGNTIGSFIIENDGTVNIYSIASETNIAAGDLITVVAPADSLGVARVAFTFRSI